MSNLNEIAALAADLTNWKQMRDVPKLQEQFTYQKLKHLFWKAEEHKGLGRCSRMVGRTRYINLPLFGLWLAGELPEQQ